MGVEHNTHLLAKFAKQRILVKDSMFYLIECLSILGSPIHISTIAPICPQMELGYKGIQYQAPYHLFKSDLEFQPLDSGITRGLI